eukprot:CAMPEP_0170396980 /NCGR_PEP_ID=MMETSP0117_2-20130122/22624_1 /TAXON_ID=400756 /ORGANISM="Durinskia baltica, Strain CSIRO CS-38" /LENGTH=74 /DNA_ID=CAMNT_0010653439 /DNA_START=6 /DNA_END=227 /DNA_ORIENTATION=-
MHLLPAGELELRAAQRFSRDLHLLVLGADGDEHGADFHTGCGAVGLAEGSAHARRKAIGARTRERFVDAEDVVG